MGTSAGDYFVDHQSCRETLPLLQHLTRHQAEIRENFCVLHVNWLIYIATN